MLNDLDFFVSVFFQFTLFFLLLVFLIRIFRNVGLPMLYEGISLKKRYWSDFFEKKRLVEILKSNAQKDLVEQNLRLVSLEHKIDLWQSVLLKKNKMLNKFKSEIAIEVEAKKELQQKNLFMSKLQAEAFPEALKEAQKDLLNQYSGSNGSILLKKLFQRLGRFEES